MTRVTVVGAGLTGTLIALLLAKQHNYQVTIIEKRNNNKQHEQQLVHGIDKLKDSEKRSINLALSHRGIEALKAAGIFEFIRPSLIPMKGRVVHPLKGKVVVQPYGLDHQAIYSVSRSTLNQLLIEQLENLSNVSIIFDTKINRINSDGSYVMQTKGSEPKTEFSDLIIGADGAFSAVRDSLIKIARINYQQDYVPWGYKELTIPSIDGEFALENPDGLHIWPRHNFMLIALPNPDKTFTCTLFAPYEGDTGLDAIPKIGVTRFFQDFFPDVISKIPHLDEQFKENPTSPLLTIKCDPWYFEDKVVLIGDAAHATVPFYGQGMNAGFEDCLLFSEILKGCDGDIAATLKRFNQLRQPAGVALCELSLGNFKDMSSNTVSPLLQLKKKFDYVLHRLMPNTWIPLYSMVAFTRIPYDECIRRADKQDRLLKFALLNGLIIGLSGIAGYMFSRHRSNKH
jgi:kynurenine 3-monooxygenase